MVSKIHINNHFENEFRVLTVGWNKVGGIIVNDAPAISQPLLKDSRGERQTQFIQSHDIEDILAKSCPHEPDWTYARKCHNVGVLPTGYKEYWSGAELVLA